MSQDEAVQKSKKAAFRFFIIVAAVIFVWFIIAMANLNSKTAANKKSETDTRIKVMEDRYGPITKEIADKAEADAKGYYDAYYERIDSMNKMGTPESITDSDKQTEYVSLRRGADNMATHYNLIMADKDYYWGGLTPSGLPAELPQLYGNTAN